MCIVSMVGDQYNDDWTKRWPQITPFAPYKPGEKDDGCRPLSPEDILKKMFPKTKGPTQEEFDALKREVEEMKELLKQAKKQDEAAGTPNCEMESKIALLRTIAKAVGVDLDEVFGKPNGTNGK